MRILVVDDSEDSRDIAEAAMLSAGYADIVTAASGWEAIQILDVGRTADENPCVDVVLLDILMPEMDGIETCARIRNDPRYADLPIIMVTALDDVTSLSNAFVAGATDYVTKPVNRIELVARVRAALRLKQELDRRHARELELLTFLSSWGDRRASELIDETTGLFAGEVAEAYLSAFDGDEAISVIALTLDRQNGNPTNGGAEAKTAIASAAHAVRRLPAAVGLVAAAYKNGMLIFVAPELGAESARKLGEDLHATVQKLRLPNSESAVSDYVTASVAVITGRAKRHIDRIQLLTQAIAAVQQAATAGGNRVAVFSADAAGKGGNRISENLLRKEIGTTA
jgi:PleD family two-component response regulator